MMAIKDDNERRAMYLSMSVIGFSAIAIILLVFGLTIIFYIVAVIAIIIGYYFARSLPAQGQQQPQAQKKRR